jgi:hypothetical protein
MKNQLIKTGTHSSEYQVAVFRMSCSVVQYSGSHYFAAMTYMTHFDGNTKISVTYK